MEKIVFTAFVLGFTLGVYFESILDTAKYMLVCLKDKYK